jgi:spore germination protein YaaH
LYYILEGKGGFDKDLVQSILSTRDNRARRVKVIVELTTGHGYDGIEIDYEMLYNTDRENFSLFMQELGNALHKEKKLLAIAVHPKESETGPDWGGWGPISQDWKALGKAVDIFRITTTSTGARGRTRARSRLCPATRTTWPWPSVQWTRAR